MFINVVLIIHLMLAIALVIVVLLQRSEGGALGMGGGGGGGFMTARGSGNVMTKITASLAFLFMVTSIGLAIMAGGRGTPSSIMDRPPATTAPVQAPSQPAAPETPTVPLAK